MCELKARGAKPPPPPPAALRLDVFLVVAIELPNPSSPGILLRFDDGPSFPNAGG